jgi:lysozyme family protein
VAFTIEQSRAGYSNLFKSATIQPNRRADVDAVVARLLRGRSRYEALGHELGVPWYFIAILHERESACDFGTYLGNGQPLKMRTTIEPKGRGPFATFEDGARDALAYQGYLHQNDWSLPAMLWRFEAFNGWGYLGKGVNSPYVWGATTLQQRGKYIRDGVFSRSVWDTQIGAAAMILGLIDGGHIVLPDYPAHSAPVAPAPSPDSEAVKWVQTALNQLGFDLVVDGISGDATQTAIMTFQHTHDLIVNGLADTATVSALKQAIQPTQQLGDDIMNSIFHMILGNTQVQSLIRSALHAAGIALLLKFGISGTAAESTLSPILDAICGLVAGGAGLFLSAQTASPFISNPTRIDPTQSPQA